MSLPIRSRTRYPIAPQALAMFFRFIFLTLDYCTLAPCFRWRICSACCRFKSAQALQQRQQSDMGGCEKRRIGCSVERLREMKRKKKQCAQARRAERAGEGELRRAARPNDERTERREEAKKAGRSRRERRGMQSNGRFDCAFLCVFIAAA